MKKVLFSFLLMLFMAFTINAQAISNDVRVSAGVVDTEGQTLFTANAEIRKSLGSNRFGLVNTLSTVTDGDTALVQNQAVVRFAPVKNFFAAGGISVGKFQGTDPFVTPVVQAGANFDISRFNIEPFVQLETPDLASDNPSRTLSGNLTVKLRITDRFGLVGNGALRATRINNDFFEGAVTKVATGGVYFTF